MTDEPIDVFADPELVEMLSAEPELLAIADAIAQTQPRVGSRSRPRRTSILIAAAIAVIVVVLPAVAWTATPQIKDWFSSAPAPAAITKNFEDLSKGAPSGMDPRVKPGEARLLSQLQLSNGSTTRLFIAPTNAGGYCFEVEGFSDGCNATRDNPFDAGFAAKRYPQGPAVTFGSILTTRAIEADLTLGQHPPVRIPLTRVSEPVDAAFFVYEVNDLPSSFPIKAKFLDEHSNVIAQRTIAKPPAP